MVSLKGCLDNPTDNPIYARLLGNQQAHIVAKKSLFILVVKKHFRNCMPSLAGEHCKVRKNCTNFGILFLTVVVYFLSLCDSYDNLRMGCNIIKYVRKAL